MVPFPIISFYSNLYCAVWMLSSPTVEALKLFPEESIKTSCPGEMLTFICIAHNATDVQWNIHFVQSSMIDIRVTLIEDDPIALVYNVTRAGHIFSFNILSQDPMISELITTAATVLDEAVVQCRDVSSHNKNVVFDGIDIFIIDQVPPSPMNIAWHQSHNKNNANSTVTTFVSLEWDLNNTNLVATFIVEITSNGESPMYYTTSNTTFQLPVVYNCEYNVTVFASNCIGNSTPANLSLLITYCPPPSITRDVNIEGYDSGEEHSQIIFNCRPGLLPSTPIVANCTRGGYWNPNPSELSCKVGCQIPASHSLILLIFWDSMITYRCTKNNTLGNTTVLQSVCTEEGQWIPNPEDRCQPGPDGDNVNKSDDHDDRTCLQNIIIITASSSLFSALVFTTMGLFCGIYITSKRAVDNRGTITAVNRMPMYEDITLMTALSRVEKLEVSENMAYGNSNN